MTYTYILMDVSPAVYEEIKQKLLAAGYTYAIHNEGQYGFVLDMHGIALKLQSEPEPTPHADAKVRAKTRAGKPL
jgi:hypothetical protein